jgi:WD40 repeat protein/DNA-binding SARP family transcriptional activator/energy-coupling factor transporter ATP-binding protein EcfA2
MGGCRAGNGAVTGLLTQVTAGRTLTVVARIGVLGPVAVDGAEGTLPPREQVVLAALTVYRGEVVSAETLADAWWGERVPPTWTKALQGCLVQLRKALGAGAIETRPQGYCLLVPADEVDAGRFERHVARAQELLTLGEPDRAAFVVDEGLGLWRGRALVELDGWEPGRAEAARLEALRLDAEELRLDAMVRAGRFREVLAEAQVRVAEEPLREHRWRLLALAQYQAGRQGDALRTLHRARRVLAEELGLDPGPDLVALEAAILRQDPSLIAEQLPESSPVCPYLGLVPYDIGDADGFFGRDADVSECLARLADTGVLAVVGPSGSGKSSLVRAGIAAALQRDGRRVVVVTPGARPTDALSAAADSHRGSVLVVDQCEEAVTLCTDADEREAFFAALVDHAQRVPLVVALRADRLGELSAHPGFARIVERGLFLLQAMGEDDLRAAIEGPARQAGLRLEPGLVDLLVRDVEGEPGALPLLSHALRQTWQRREGRTLTVAGYRASGGIRGAVAQSAEQLYEQAPADQRPVMRDLLLRLVAPSPEGEPVRSRVPRRAVATDAQHEQVIEQLVSARLVISDQDVVELAHEALARAWPRLRGWLDDDVEGQRIWRHLTAAADSWDAMGRPDSELYRGVRLDQAVEWRDRATPDVNPVERAFLDAGRTERDRQRHRDAEELNRTARANRRLRAQLVALGIALVVAMVAGLVALRQRDRAQESATDADARRVGAQALVAEDIDRSLLLAAEGVRLDDSTDTRANLLAALSRNPALFRSARIDDGLITLDVSPNGKVVAVGGPFKGVSFRDGDSLEELGTLDEPPWRMQFRPDGKQIAMAVNPLSFGPTGFPPIPALLVDATTFEQDAVQLGGQPGPNSSAADLRYSVDGRYLAISFELYARGEDFPTSTVVAVWDVTVPGRPIRRVDLPPNPTGAGHSAVLSPDGSLLYVGSVDPPSLAVYRVATGELVRSATVPGDPIDISPAGTQLAAAAGPEILLLDAATLAERGRLRGHTEPIRRLRFSHDGAVLASSSDDRTAIVWDLATGDRLEQLRGHAGSVWDVAFSPDDTTLYTSSTDQALLAWDLDGARRLAPRVAVAEPVASPAVDPLEYFARSSPTGEAVAYVTITQTAAAKQTATVQWLDVRSGEAGDVVDTGHPDIGAHAWRPDGRRFATTGEDGFVRVWDWRTGDLVSERRAAQAPITGLDYNSDGTRLIMGEETGAIRTIDAQTLTPVGPTIQLDDDDDVTGVFASPDNRTAVALTSEAGSEPGFALIDLADGRVVHEGPLALEPLYADFSPDGQRIAISYIDRVGVLDVETGEWLRTPVEGHEEGIPSLAYSPDGSLVASGGRDGRVGLWDGRTGDLLATMLPGRPNTPVMVEFLPDGHTVLISSLDGALYTWDTRVQPWVDHACAVAGRNLSQDEWRDAFRDRPYHRTCPQHPAGK